MEWFDQAVDEGAQIRVHPSGVRVIMKKAFPGIFYAQNGSEVSAALAREAGYRVEDLLKAKLRRERMDAAMAAIDNEFITDTVNETVKEENGFRFIHVGLGRHNVLDPDGNIMNTRPLTKDEGLSLFSKIVTPRDPITAAG